MWRGFVPALVSYGVAACDAWNERGYGDSVRDSLLSFTAGKVPNQRRLQQAGHLPPWLGHPTLHTSHQSALLRKEPERYQRLFEGVAVDLPYFWPADCFPRWPFRRPRAAPVEPPEALVGAGFEQFLPGQREAASAIHGGRDALCCFPPKGGATCAGLMAAMTRPAAALWVWPGRPPELGKAAPVRRDGRNRETATRPGAASTARPPTERDTAEIEAEIAAEREHLYRHPAELANSATTRQGRRVGLIVVERACEMSRADRALIADARVLHPGAPLLALATPVGAGVRRHLTRELGLKNTVVVEQ